MKNKLEILLSKKKKISINSDNYYKHSFHNQLLLRNVKFDTRSYRVNQ